MKTHEIKINEFAADDVFNARKIFEVRDNDRLYQVGDHIRYKVVDKYGKSLEKRHPLEYEEFEITYVQSGPGIQYGYVVFSIRPVTEYMDPLKQTSPLDGLVNRKEGNCRVDKD